MTKGKRLGFSIFVAVLTVILIACIFCPLSLFFPPKSILFLLYHNISGITILFLYFYKFLFLSHTLDIFKLSC